jgi:hypothetical protein
MQTEPMRGRIFSADDRNLEHLLISQQYDAQVEKEIELIANKKTCLGF